MSTNNILDSWPSTYKPRINQLTALNWISKQKAKYLILECPVGSGKSDSGITFSRYIGNRTNNGDSYILTPQRILQQQYVDSFSSNKLVNLSSLFGKGNYTCDNKNTSCAVGSIIKPRCSSCPYSAARDAAKLASNTVLNYKLALTTFKHTDTFSPRKLVIMDECHTLESHLVNFDIVSIQEWFSTKYTLPFKKQKSMEDALSWIKNYYKDALYDKIQELESDIIPIQEKSGSELTSRDIKKIQDIEYFAKHACDINLLLNCTQEYIDQNYVLVSDLVSFQFKRLYGSYTFDHLIKPMGTQFLFMSSTILNKDEFCADLGIPVNETAFLSIDSDFPVKNRPIYYMPQMKMNYKWNDTNQSANRKQMISSIILLCKSHGDESGIIHTGNFAVAKWLVDELSNNIPQIIFHHNPDIDTDRTEVIDGFLRCKQPGILISPSSTEGLDLKYNLGKFAIFAKVPYGYLGDQWIKKRMEISNEWYRRQAMTNIIQGCGRIVRADDDSGTVYILDGCFGYLMQQSRDIIPQWWKDSYIEI